jgi:hypothetical protein
MKKTRRKIGIIPFITNECLLQRGALDFVIDRFNEKFELTLNNQESNLELYARDRLDYELETAYEFRILAKCGGNGNGGLWSRMIRVELIDINDNQPKFLSPIGNGQIIFVEINSFTSLYFLMQIKGITFSIFF